jgi:hypothetical protein
MPHGNELMDKFDDLAFHVRVLFQVFDGFLDNAGFHS